MEMSCSQSNLLRPQSQTELIQRKGRDTALNLGLFSIGQSPCGYEAEQGRKQGKCWSLIQAPPNLELCVAVQFPFISTFFANNAYCILAYISKAGLNNADLGHL